MKSGDIQNAVSDVLNETGRPYSKRYPEALRIKYQGGYDYAVQPGRTKSGLWWNPFTHEIMPPVTVPWKDFVPLRIRILSIRREDVRNISEADALSEGGYSPFEYLCLWTSMHDKVNLISLKGSTLQDYTATRPAARYDAWVLTFEVVK